MSAAHRRRLTCTVDEAAALLGISRGKAYQCVREGQLRSVHIGRRILVPLDAVDELLAGTAPARPIPLRARRRAARGLQ